MSNNTTSKDIKEHRTKPMTPEEANAMVKACRRKGLDVISVNEDSEGGGCLIKIRK